MLDGIVTFFALLLVLFRYATALVFPVSAALPFQNITFLYYVSVDKTLATNRKEEKNANKSLDFFPLLLALIAYGEIFSILIRGSYIKDLSVLHMRPIIINQTSSGDNFPLILGQISQT